MSHHDAAYVLLALALAANHASDVLRELGLKLSGADKSADD